MSEKKKEKWYKHPNRHPKNVDGPFYSLAEKDNGGCWHSECLDCELPQAEAKPLMKSLGGDDGDTYFIKQPENSEELEMAITATHVCCIGALRYAGTDPEIIKRMNKKECDHFINRNGKVELKNEYVHS